MKVPGLVGISISLLNTLLEHGTIPVLCLPFLVFISTIAYICLFARNGNGCCLPIIIGERNGAICMSKYCSSKAPSSLDNLLKLIRRIPAVSSSPISCSYTSPFFFSSSLTLSRIALTCSSLVIPVLFSLTFSCECICIISVPTRTIKNSSRLVWYIDANVNLSASGTFGLTASFKTLSLNASHDNSLFV